MFCTELQLVPDPSFTLHPKAAPVFPVQSPVPVAAVSATGFFPQDSPFPLLQLSHVSPLDQKTRGFALTLVKMMSSSAGVDSVESLRTGGGKMRIGGGKTRTGALSFFFVVVVSLLNAATEAH